MRVYTSQEDATTFSRVAAGVLNDTSDGVTRQKLGIVEGGNYIYNNHIASTPFNILARSEIAVATTIKNSTTGGKFSPASLVGAQSNEDVTIRLTVTNNGSTELEKLKIYNILPYNGDPLNSEGSVKFKEVLSSKANIQPKFTITPVTELAGYGEHNTGTGHDTDLQANIPGTWTNNKEGATALLVDYGNIRLRPGESIETDLVFTIPDEVSQTVFNQFRYSAQEVGNANVKFNLNSTKAGFSTEYKDDVPPKVELIGRETVTISVGDSFVDAGANWTDNIDGNGKITKGKIISKDGQTLDSDETPTEVGVYVLEYVYTDAAGNPSNKVTRTVTISPANKDELRTNTNTGTELENNSKLVGINGVPTATAKQKLTEALREARVILDNPNATQKEVNAANTKLKEALKNITLDTTPPEIIFPNNLQDTIIVGTNIDLKA